MQEKYVKCLVKECFNRGLNFDDNKEDYLSILSDLSRSFTMATYVTINEWKETAKDGDIMRVNVVKSILDIEVERKGDAYTMTPIFNTALQKAIKGGEDFIPENDVNLKSEEQIDQINNTVEKMFQ